VQKTSGKEKEAEVTATGFSSLHFKATFVPAQTASNQAMDPIIVSGVTRGGNRVTQPVPVTRTKGKVR
jgi:hypothetical protein